MKQQMNASGSLVLVLACLMTANAIARPDDAAECRAVFAKGQAAEQQGDYAAAAQHYERAMQLAPRVFGPDHANTAATINNLANVYQRLGKYAAAEALHRRGLAIEEKNHGPDHPEVATSLNNLANVCQDQGKTAEAERLHRRALAIREKALGPNHVDTALTLSNLAIVYRRQGKAAEAEAHYRRAMAIREKALGPNHPDVANSLSGLALLAWDKARYDEAERLFRQALAIEEKVYGPGHPEVAETVAHLALALNKQGKRTDAEPLYRRALAIREKVFGLGHPAVATSLVHLADLAKDQSRYAEAEPLYRRALAIREKALGPDHVDTAVILYDLAVVNRDRGKTAEAEVLFRQALAIQEKALGPDHTAVAVTLNGLGLLYWSMDKTTEAEATHRRALSIREKALGPNHPDVADCLNNLAILCRGNGRYAEAEPLLRRALTIWEAAYHPDHRLVADGVNNLAYLYQIQGKAADAEALHRRALASKEKTLGPDHPSTAQSLDNLAVLQAGQKNWAEAAVLLERERRGVRRFVARELPALPETDQLIFLRAADQRRFHTALAVGLERRDDPTIADRSAGWLLNGKAVAHQALAERSLRNPRRAAAADPWVGLDDVRRALPADGTLVEIARFRRYDFAKNRPLPARYAAWVVPPAGAGGVRVIDLGSADEIDDAVEAVRGTLAEAARPDGPVRTKGEPAAEADLRWPLDALARLVLRPLLPHLGSRPKLLLSPDGDLWLIPWAALPLPDGKYAVEAYAITLLVSGRDLAAGPQPNRTDAGPPAVLADPDFDLALPTANRPGADGLRGLAVATKLPHASRLPGTATEATAVRPSVQKFTGREPRLYLDGDAREAVAKSLMGPRVVVFSTHGFALPDQDAGGDGKAGSKLENPLLRCGLLLAGCNRRGQGAAEDGVLTGLEIVGTDLRGTELVVLSACETGLGDVRNGEGVAGLRQAFQLAGAQSVVATLWQVPDRDSAKLMAAFFDSLAAGKPKADALRAAQLAQIESRRQRNAAAHPFFWAAYTLTGQ
ncbi:MAG: CHAT domain-containing tetratricopeptide repeat protein [Gemmataceae bacterium]